MASSFHCVTVSTLHSVSDVWDPMGFLLFYKLPEMRIFHRDWNILGVQHKYIGSMNSLRSVGTENAGNRLGTKKSSLLLTVRLTLCCQITFDKLVGILVALSCGRYI